MTELSKPENRKVIKAFVFVIGGMTVLSLVMLLIPEIAAGTWLTNKLLWDVVISGLVILAGYTAYFMREWHRLSYALFEIAFGVGYGIWAACNIGIPTDMTPQQGFTLAGCVYIIVRGGNNLKEAKEKKLKLSPEDSN
jgi:hypothetical protein